MQSNAAMEYNYSIVKLYMWTTVIFGIVGMLIGVIIAAQLAWPDLNYLLGEYGTFSRLRPVHTNVVVYGFMISGIFVGFYYSAQRVLKVSMGESKLLMTLSYLQFFLYLIAASGMVISEGMGITTSKEYAQMEWPLDILIVVIWVLWGVIMFGLIGLRREKALYISMWYYVATFLGVAMLYLFNNMEIPTMLLSGNLGAWYHSVSMYAGTNDAMVQWWWGHNAVAFVFTVPIIALIYYFLPKESGQAVYSYKLSLLSFWGLMFIYLWAGGHHLLWSTVPDWVQTMASIFSVILILPSWGSAINMLLTMKGEWNQLTDNPLIKFMILASTFYMLSTLEGPIQAVKSVNAIAHFTDWIPGHVHDGVLGWVAFMVFATLMHAAPRVFKREIYSKSLLEAQFWLQTVAVVLYFTSMWVAGITQGMMWRAVDEYGNLMYSFIDTVNVLHPYWAIRAIGGLLYFIGLLMFAWNFFMTATAGRKLETEPQFRSPMA